MSIPREPSPLLILSVRACTLDMVPFTLSIVPAMSIPSNFPFMLCMRLPASEIVLLAVVIIVPAFNHQKPCKPHTQETRDFLCEQYNEMGTFAAQHNTTVIFEPLNRKEAFYLRQVGDAASLCRDINNPGVRCMGDFWHMTWEENSDMGAFLSAGEYLQHVHVASRKRRSMPGEDGEADNYVEGFRALKMMGYDKYVSFECGCQGDRNVVLPAAVELLRKQWEEA